MWIQSNPNPKSKQVPDCVIRAISIVFGVDWYSIYDALCRIGRMDCNMPSADSVWGHFLSSEGCYPFLLSDICPKCTTVKMFCEFYPIGRYIIGTGSHAIAVIDGNYYDSWDSGNEIPSFFWKVN